MRNLLVLANLLLFTGCVQVQDLGGGSGDFQCGSDGDVCSTDTDCCAGLCVSGACAAEPACAPDGNACVSYSDCCSQQCSNGACTSASMCGGDGAACAADSDCCSQLLCVGGACGSPQQCAADGAACAADSDCCSQSLCVGGVCGGAPLCAPDGDVCVTDADCCLPLLCASGVCGSAPMCAPDGAACVDDADCCQPLVCTGGVCNNVFPICASDGEACVTDADCCPQLPCTAGVCGAPPMCAGNGDACAVDSDCCAPLLCTGGACAVNGPVTYATGFEGACPDGWTLTGDWQCGVPMNGGPPSAYAGAQCIGTKIAGTYSDGDSWAGTTATSPAIDLTNNPSPVLFFRMWVDTEGSTYDGANLQISTDGGMNFSIVTSVMPAYMLTVEGKPAWGGHQNVLGWQFIQADLSSFAGQVVLLRFAFRSDTSGTFPGVYIDDIIVN